MLRSRANHPSTKTSSSNVTTGRDVNDVDEDNTSDAAAKKSSKYGKGSKPVVLGMMMLVVGMSLFLLNTASQGPMTTPPQQRLSQPSVSPGYTNKSRIPLSAAFDGMIQRAKLQQQHCQALGVLDTTSDRNDEGLNGHTAHLTSFGFLQDLVDYQQGLKAENEDMGGGRWECILPPETECQESQFTVIFMAHNPDRLNKMMSQIQSFQTDRRFAKLVKQVVVVWNGQRQILEQSSLGQQLLLLSIVRVDFPLEHGFPNDLFNRYHPRLAIPTKAILYYDDDGPFYSYEAILGGFELWKRNANAQIGAMARKLDFSPRQLEEHQGLLTKEEGGNPAHPRDRFFISHCSNDQIRYNYNEFAQFGAKMVLPSGSFIHSNYLPCLWHDLFQPLRKYIQDHPVHPDDGTVSMIISQLSGRAPKVYSRRINMSTNAEKGRQLLQQERSLPRTNQTATTTSPDGNRFELDYYHSTVTHTSYSRQARRLMDGIDWDAPGAHAKKMDWGKLRSDVANSLARYFGSVNSGSLGWCYGTTYQKDESCQPDQAKLGMIPWLNPDHTARTTCP